MPGHWRLRHGLSILTGGYCLRLAGLAEGCCCSIWMFVGAPACAGLARVAPGAMARAPEHYVWIGSPSQEPTATSTLLGIKATCPSYHIRTLQTTEGK